MTTALTVRQQNLIATGPVGNLDAYIQAVQSVPVLKVEQEQELAIRFRENDDVEAARSLVIAHLRFVVHIARGYMGYGLPLGDLVQEGNVGLMKAVKRFDPAVGVRLVSFAVHWIRAEIHEFVLRNWRVVKVATTKAQRKLFFNLRKAKRHLGWLSHEETRAVAEDLGVSESDVTEMERRLSARDLSFDPAPGSEDDEDGGYSPQAWLPADDDDPAQAMEDADWEAATHDSLTRGLEALDERSQDIIRSRWLTEKKATLHQLADRYSVSAERIRQIEAAAIKKLSRLVDAEAV